MLRVFIVLFSFFFLNKGIEVQAQITFTDFEQVINHIKTESKSAKTGQLVFSQAETDKLIAIYGVIDPNINLNASYQNNTQLPVNLIPSEIFGGTSGTFQEVQFGIQYNTNLNAYGEIKLLNIQGIKQMKLSKVNIDRIISNNNTSLNDLSKNVCQSYFNIVTLQNQINSNAIYLKISDSLLLSAENKLKEGLIRNTELNEFKIQKYITEDQGYQLMAELERQIIGFKILCGIGQDQNVVIQHVFASSKLNSESENNTFLKKYEIEEQYAKTNYGLAKSSFYPTLSFFASSTSQQFNETARLYNSGNNWINSSYLGFKVSVPIFHTSQFSNLSKAKNNLLMANSNLEFAKIEHQLNKKQLESKVLSTQVGYSNALEISKLRRENFNENNARFLEGLISTSDLLTSLRSLQESQFNELKEKVELEKSKYMIYIYNSL